MRGYQRPPETSRRSLKELLKARSAATRPTPEGATAAEEPTKERFFSRSVRLRTVVPLTLGLAAVATLAVLPLVAPQLPGIIETHHAERILSDAGFQPPQLIITADLDTICEESATFQSSTEASACFITDSLETIYIQAGISAEQRTYSLLHEYYNLESYASGAAYNPYLADEFALRHGASPLKAIYILQHV